MLRLAKGIVVGMIVLSCLMIIGGMIFAIGNPDSPLTPDKQISTEWGMICFLSGWVVLVAGMAGAACLWRK